MEQSSGIGTGHAALRNVPEPGPVHGRSSVLPAPLAVALHRRVAAPAVSSRHALPMLRMPCYLPGFHLGSGGSSPGDPVWRADPAAWERRPVAAERSEPRGLVADTPLCPAVIQDRFECSRATAAEAQRLASNAIASAYESIASARVACERAAAARGDVQARRSGEPGSGA